MGSRGPEKEENWMGSLGPGGQRASARTEMNPSSLFTPPAAVLGELPQQSRGSKPDLAPATLTDLRKPRVPSREPGRGKGVRGKVSDYRLPLQGWGGATCLGNMALLFSSDEPLPFPGTPMVRQGDR